ncbi:MAG: SIS domain-containing protein [Pseudomonadota bacterium]
MTTILQHSPEQWHTLGGLHTATEIGQQPAVWRALQARLEAARPRLDAFLGNCLADPRQQVILTGAGSSAYVGEIVADQLNATWPAQVRAIATTSLLTHADLYLDTGAPLLLVSFARSGDSPESLAAVALVHSMVPGARLLNITCNADGTLARECQANPLAFNLLMPAASCDQGFAMTSSFSCMLLAALAVLDRRAGPDRIVQLALLAERALDNWAPVIGALAEQAFDRVVYLGSGPLEGLAKESALKLLELSGGSVTVMAATPLGFRHGPKSMLTAGALVIAYGSTCTLARRYERDLFAELERDGVAGAILCVGAGTGPDFDIDAPDWPDAWLAPLWLLFAQQYALYRSAALGLRPDNPFASGVVNRVVKGVTIYRHDAA